MATVEARVVGKFYNGIPSPSVLVGFTDILVGDDITTTAGDAHDFTNLYARRRVGGEWVSITLPDSFYYLNQRGDTATTYILYKFEKRPNSDVWDRLKPSDSVGFVIDYSTGRHYRRVNDTTLNDEALRAQFTFIGYLPKPDANGNLVLTQPGAHLTMPASTPASDFAGTATLVAGTVTVANTNIQTTDLIFVSRTALGGTPGYLDIGGIVAGTSFTIVSSNNGDTSTVAYFIVRPYA